jgi:hypothetical protein
MDRNTLPFHFQCTKHAANLPLPSPPLPRAITAEVDELCKPAAGSEVVSFKHTHASSQWTQFTLLLDRALKSYWRMPAYNNLRFIVTILCGVVFGTIFLDRGSKFDTLLGLMDILGALYSTTVFMGIANCLIILPVINGERAVFYRERASGMYNTLAYTMAQGMVELPYLLAQGIIYTIMVRSRGSKPAPGAGAGGDP